MRRGCDCWRPSNRNSFIAACRRTRPQPYELDALRRQGLFGESVLSALRQAGVVPDSFLSEFGPQQFEVTVAPAIGLRAADEAVITRELTQAVAYRLGQRVSFTPLPDPQGTSNGTHIHWSFLNADGQPVLYDEGQPRSLSVLGSRFVAGVLHHLPMLCAVTAPSVASYYRLRPNRWAPVRADVGTLDRGTALRLCPAVGHDPVLRARQFNIEFRVADATASPYLALAMLVQAGLDGVRQQMDIDAPPAGAALEFGAGVEWVAGEPRRGRVAGCGVARGVYRVQTRRDQEPGSTGRKRDLPPLCRSLLINYWLPMNRRPSSSRDWWGNRIS